MTGAFLRVEREGKWENIEVEHLTEIELSEIIGSRNKDEIMNWLKMTCNALRFAEKVVEENNAMDG